MIFKGTMLLISQSEGHSGRRIKEVTLRSHPEKGVHPPFQVGGEEHTAQNRAHLGLEPVLVWVSPPNKEKAESTCTPSLCLYCFALVFSDDPGR